MGVFTGNLLWDLLSIIVALVAVFIAFHKWRFTYWDRIGVPSLPTSIPYGNTKDLLLQKLSSGEQFKILYDEFKAKGLKYGGIYFGSNPFLIPTDLEIVKSIMQSDFQHFVNHGFYINEKNDPLSGHLFALEDEKWRQMRTKLTPTFTSGKMKMMFETLANCAIGLKSVIDKCATDRRPVDIKDVLACFTTDVIGSCAFGLECNSLQHPDTEFRTYGKKVFSITGLRWVKTAAQFFLPYSLLDAIKFKLTDSGVEKFFMKVVEDTLKYREKNNVYRKDFMHLLIQLKNRGKVTDDGEIADNGQGILSFNEMAAQAFVFFLAGFETSSTLMTFALYELAIHPEIQSKLREEITEVLSRNQNELTYDAIMQMTYMDQVFNETLRKYPPLPNYFRRCTKDYTLPGTTTVLKRGTYVMISSLGIQNDPEFFPEPEKFDPERFSDEEKAKRPHFAWIPFGEGPRLCIGLRFGLMQSKVGLATMLKNYRITLNSKTKLPITLEKTAVVTSVEGGVWLDVEALK